MERRGSPARRSVISLEAIRAAEALEDHGWMPLSHVYCDDFIQSLYCYEPLEKINEGSQGTVYRAQRHRSSEIVAVKLLLSAKAGTLKMASPSVLREISILRAVQHENIIRFEAVAVNDNGCCDGCDGSDSDGEHISVAWEHCNEVYPPIPCIVMEWAEFALADLIDDATDPFRLGEVKCLFRQFLKGLRYIHDNDIIHRDLKTENILVATDGTLKIADFGFARLKPESIRPMTPLVTTIWYAAPEMLLEARIYTPAVDMFAAGVVLAELLLGEALFQVEENPQLLKLMCRMLGPPSLEDMWAFAQLGCIDFAPALFDFTVPTDEGSLAIKFESRGVETVQVLRDMLRWGPLTRLTAAEGLGEGTNGEAALAWWDAEPHAVAKEDLWFVQSPQAAALREEASGS